MLNQAYTRPLKSSCCLCVCVLYSSIVLFFNCLFNFFTTHFFLFIVSFIIFLVMKTLHFGQFTHTYAPGSANNIPNNTVASIVCTVTYSTAQHTCVCIDYSRMPNIYISSIKCTSTFFVLSTSKLVFDCIPNRTKPNTVDTQLHGCVY